MLNIIDDYDDFVKNTDSEKDNIDILISSLLLLFPSGVLVLSLLNLKIWTSIKPNTE